MGRVPTADAEPDTIVQEYEAGYTLHGRLLRPSKVVIAMEAPAPEAEPPVRFLKLSRFLESLPRSGLKSRLGIYGSIASNGQNDWYRPWDNQLVRRRC